MSNWHKYYNSWINFDHVQGIYVADTYGTGSYWHVCCVSTSRNTWTLSDDFRSKLDAEEHMNAILEQIKG